MGVSEFLRDIKESAGKVRRLFWWHFGFRVLFSMAAALTYLHTRSCTIPTLRCIRQEADTNSWVKTSLAAVWMWCLRPLLA